MTKHTLESAAQQIADATSNPGNAGTYGRLVRELAVGTNAALGWYRHHIGQAPCDELIATCR